MLAAVGSILAACVGRRGRIGGLRGVLGRSGVESGVEARARVHARLGHDAGLGAGIETRLRSAQPELRCFLDSLSARGHGVVRPCALTGRAEVTGPTGAHTLQCRAARPLDQAILLSTFPEIGTKAEAEAFRRVAAQVRLTRYGMDCYGYALLAAGQVDLVIEAGLQSYDVMAPIAVIEAAGGLVTNWQGGPAHHGGQVLAAANRDVHAAALALLA